MKKRKLFILLTKFPDAGAKAIKAITGFNYTHASIGLEEDMNTFYSFVNKGFIVEKITRYLKPDREPFPCQLYVLEVSDKVYQATKKVLDYFVNMKPTFRYAKMGVVLGLFHVPYKRKYCYFCSHFVASVLEQAKAVVLKKSSALYFPKDFRKLPGVRLYFQGNLQSFVNKFSLA